jgi:predicted nucleotidyltransferase
MNKAIELKDKLVQLFSTRKEVSEILIFGKIAENKFDNYSDVDIKIISNDPYLTQATLHKTISRISPIRETFVLASDRNSFAEMIMLKRYMPYQKIDIGIERKGAGVDFKPITSVYKNNKALGDDRDCLIHSMHTTCDYNLNNFLFGVPRFIKCCYRKDFDLYRRWKGMTDRLLCLIYEKYFGWLKVTDIKKLDVPNSKKLYEALNNKDKSRLQNIYPLNGNVNLIKSFSSTLLWYIELSKEKAIAQKIKLNHNFIKYISYFARKELAKL